MAFINVQEIIKAGGSLSSDSKTGKTNINIGGQSIDVSGQKTVTADKGSIITYSNPIVTDKGHETTITSYGLTTQTQQQANEQTTQTTQTQTKSVIINPVTAPILGGILQQSQYKPSQIPTIKAEQEAKAFEQIRKYPQSQEARQVNYLEKLMLIEKLNDLN
jgi:hypothetical protein